MRWSSHILALGAALCMILGTVSPAQAKAKYVIKFGTVAPDGTPWANQLKAIKKRIEKQSNGQIKMKLYLGGMLGGEVEMVRAVRRGRLQGWGGSTASVAEGARIPQLQLMELPFLFRSFAEADHVLDKVVRDDYVKILAKKGFAFAQWHENGWRNFASKKKPIKTLADLQGMKMRSQESPVHLAMYKALNTQAISMPVPEVLGALQTNMVDGFSNTPLFTASTGWYEGIEYFTITHHIYQPASILYNKEFFDSLPEDLQKVLIGDRAAETKLGRDTVRGMTPELLDMFRETGITVYEMTPEERAAFVELTKDVPDQFNDTIGRSLINTVKAAQKMYRAQQ